MTLFHSVREQIFSLPDSWLLYPGHDYKGRTVTTAGEEKRFNPRLGLAQSLEEFLAIMAALNLSAPKRMEVAVPANLESGTAACANEECSREARARSRPVAQAMERVGRQNAEFWHGMGI